VLAQLAAAVTAALVVALATPAPAPVPRPTETNPFNLTPVSPPPQLPVIGTTRSRPVCTAIRKAVAPAVAAAMRNDHTYSVLRSRVFDYIVKDSDEAKDMHLMQMDRTVDAMVKDVDALESAIKSSELDVAANTKPEDAKTLRDLRMSLAGMLAAEKTQLDVMSGFVETERMRRFGKLNETEQNMQNAINPNYAPGGGSMVTPMPLGPFLRDQQDVFNPQHPTPTGLHDGHLIDRDLGDISVMTSRYEDAATKVIVAAANSCK
jgi:hypothetical protein